MGAVKVTGKCVSCGAPAVRTQEYKGKRRRACERCAARARQGGDLMKSFVDRRREQRKKLVLRAKKMRVRGWSLGAIADRLGVHRASLGRWL